MAESAIMLEHVRYMFIIDDDAVQREMIKDYMVERYLFEVKIYETGEAAMPDIRKLQPEIIVLDYHLNANTANAKNGLEVLKEVKEVSPVTEVVMFSGEDKLDVALASMRNGAYDYVVKGESAFNKIERVIDKLGERHRLQAIATSQRKTITFLSIAIAIIIFVAIMLGVMGKY